MSLESSIQAIKVLAAASRREGRLDEFLRRAIIAAEVKPEELHRLTESLGVVSTTENSEILEKAVEQRCYFCLKTARYVKFLVAGRHANICDECIQIARTAIPRRGFARFLLGDSGLKPTAQEGPNRK